MSLLHSKCSCRAVEWIFGMWGGHEEGGPGGEEERVEVGGGTGSGDHHRNMCPTLGCRVQHDAAPLTACKKQAECGIAPLGSLRLFSGEGNKFPLPSRLAAAAPTESSSCHFGAAHMGASSTGSGCPFHCIQWGLLLSRIVLYACLLGDETINHKGNYSQGNWIKHED